MPTILPLLAVVGLTSLCAVLAVGVVYFSPNPMPAGHAQLLAALIALFSAGGYALLRTIAGPAPSIKKSARKGTIKNL